MYKLSIIIPVHEYRPQFYALLKQLYKYKWSDTEIIIVGDRYRITPESLGDIVPDFSDLNIMYSKIRLYAGLARNNGWVSSQGEYLLFLDSDIVIDNNFLRDVYSLIDKEDITISCFPQTQYKTSNILSKFRALNEKFTTWAVYKKRTKMHELHGYACLFRKDIFSRVGGWGYYPTTEHEEFAQRIREDGFDITLEYDIPVGAYHRPKVAFASFSRSKMWAKMKLRGLVSFDDTKSKYTAIGCALPSLVVLSLITGNILHAIAFYLCYNLWFRKFLHFVGDECKLLEYLPLQLCHMMWISLALFGSIVGMLNGKSKLI